MDGLGTVAVAVVCKFWARAAFVALLVDQRMSPHTGVQRDLVSKGINGRMTQGAINELINVFFSHFSFLKEKV